METIMCTKYNKKIEYKPLTLDEFYTDTAWFARQVDALAAQLRARTETETESKPGRGRTGDYGSGGYGGN